MYTYNSETTNKGPSEKKSFPTHFYISENSISINKGPSTESDTKIGHVGRGYTHYNVWIHRWMHSQGYNIIVVSVCRLS